MKRRCSTTDHTALWWSRGHSILTVLILAALGSCDDPSTGIIDSGGLPATLTVAPPVLTLNDGETGIFTSRLTGPSGRTLTSRNLEWSSTQPGVASISATGVVRANHPGQTTIRVRAPDHDLEDQAIVIVRPVADDVLFLVRDEVHIGMVGVPLADSVEVRVIDRGGLPVPGLALSFGIETGGGSVSPAIATTDANGFAKVEWTLGVEVGSNAMFASEYGGATTTGPAGAPGSDQGRVKIHGWGTAGKPDAIVVSPPSDTLEVEDRNRLTATVLDKWGNEVEGIVVDWHSEAADVAEVDAAGNVRGVREGDAIITASTNSGSSSGAQAGAPGRVVHGSASITVRPRQGLSLTRVSGSGQTGTVGSVLDEPLAVRAWDDQGNPMSGLAVSWSVSLGGGSLSTGTSTTDASGLASATWTLGTRPGPQEVTAWAPGIQNTVVFTSTAEVGAAAEVVVSPSAVDLAVGETQQFSANAYDAYGNRITDRPVTWGVSEPSVVKVDVGGFATALSGGAASVTASLDGTSGSAQVDVAGDGGSGGGGGGAGWTLTLSPSTVATRALGAVVQLTATVTDVNGAYVGDAPVEWSSLSPEVATVDDFGRVLTRSVGTALIVAATTAAADTVSVESGQFVHSVQLEPADLTLEPGESALVTATALDSLGNVMADASFDFATTDAEVVAVELATRADQRQIVAAAAGDANIVAQAGGKTDWITVVVQGPPSVSLAIADSTADSLRVDVRWSPGVGRHRLEVRQDSSKVEGVDSGFPAADSRFMVYEGIVHGDRKTISVPRLAGTSWIGGRVRSEPNDSTSSDWGYSAAMVVPGTSSSEPPPPPPPPPSGGFQAFPGAEGWGADALRRCDRSNLQVLRVSNLSDSGSGSLRDAIDRALPDRLTVIVFDVAGYIDLDRRIELTRNASCLYVAGQTAPGDGVTVRAWDNQAIFFKAGPVHDVVFRYLRFRNGTRQPGTNTNATGIVIGSGERIVLDHLSFSWANNQLLTIQKYQDDLNWGPVESISVQRSLFGEPFASSPVCYSTDGRLVADGNGVPQWYESQNLSLHHNAAIHCHHRAPMIVSKTAEVINNVIYNWSIGAVYTEGRKPYVDLVGNYFKAGPMTPVGQDFGYEFSHMFMFNRPGGHRGDEPDGYVIIGNGDNVDGRLGPGIYLSGNVGPNNPTGGLDNWTMTSKYKTDVREGPYPEVNYSSVEYAEAGLMPIRVNGVRLRRDQRLPQPEIPVTVESANAAWSALIEDGDAGANRRLDCTGNWVLNPDAVDLRLLQEARAGQGPTERSILRSQDDVGGFPQLTAGAACVDSDADGMPDAFESRYGFNLDSPADARLDHDSDGFTNLEEFLNGTRPN